MNRTARVPKNRAVYFILRPIIKILLFLLYDVRVSGRENIPKKGHFILAANHVSLADSAMIIAVCPRICHFMAKSELFKNPVIGAFLRSMNVFPVKRDKSDRTSLSYAEEVLKRGFVLGIFPEGRIKKEAHELVAKSGVALLAKRGKADVLPVSIYRDSSGRHFRPKVTIRFGKLIKNEDLGFSEKHSSEQLRKATEKIMGEISENLRKH